MDPYILFTHCKGCSELGQEFSECCERESQVDPKEFPRDSILSHHRQDQTAIRALIQRASGPESKYARFVDTSVNVRYVDRLRDPKNEPELTRVWTFVILIMIIIIILLFFPFPPLRENAGVCMQNKN